MQNMQTGEDQILMEVADVSRLIGVTPASIRRYIWAGCLKPDFVTPRGGRLFTLLTVEAFHQARKDQKAARGQRGKRA